MFNSPAGAAAGEYFGKPKAKTLWCIQPLGWNESLACPDLWSAHHYTDVANRLWGSLEWPDGSRLYFRASEWTGTAEAHTLALSEWPEAKAFMDDRKAWGEKILKRHEALSKWNVPCRWTGLVDKVNR
jgi:hypothetical protein